MIRHRRQCECPPDQICPGPPGHGATKCEPTFQLRAAPCTCGRPGAPIEPTCATPDNLCEICSKSQTCIDLVLEDDDLSTADGVLSIALVQLATKARVEDVPDSCATAKCAPSCGDFGGWWYDAFRGRNIGTRLWTLEGAPATDQPRLTAEQMFREDLEFMVDDGIVERIEVTTEMVCGTLCVKHLDLYPPAGEAKRLEVACLWRQQTTA